MGMIIQKWTLHDIIIGEIDGNKIMMLICQNNTCR